MSIRDLDALLMRLYRDADFRERLRQDADQALADYDLTPKQRQALSRLQRRKTPPTKPTRLESPPKGYSFSLN